MNVLLISTSDRRGGAAIAASRLMHALNKHGVQARMLVKEKLSDDDNVIEVGTKKGNYLRFVWERGVIFLRNWLSRTHLFDISIANTGVSVINRPEFKAADVIHLHWTNQGMLSLCEIGKIVRSGKKIVWTMHDMWAFTGICHYAAACQAYEKSCGMCPYLQRPAKNGISQDIFLKKRKLYYRQSIHFVGCSQWMKNLAQKSALTENQKVSAIPNPINTTTYQPKDKTTVRKIFSLPHDKKIILFAAVKTTDTRKGLDYLIAASRMIAEKRDDVVFLIVGGNKSESPMNLALPTHYLGYIPSGKMVDVYNAADLFVIPSLQDNLPNTIMESLACGVPCVGFEIGGIPEMIEHKQNGYVAHYQNAEDLAKGILWALFEADSIELSRNARNKVLQSYSEEIVAGKYIDLYTQLDS